MNEAAVKKLSKKRKRKLNLIDVLLIALVVLALGIFLSYRFLIAGDNVQDKKLCYQIEVENVGQSLKTDKLVGDLLYNESGICLGEVSQCSAVMTRANTVTDAEETYSKETVCYFVVTVVCDAVEYQDEYRLNGYLLEEGMELVLSSDDFVISGVCTEITEVTQ